jgi:hypothetical protein
MTESYFEFRNKIYEKKLSNNINLHKLLSLDSEAVNIYIFITHAVSITWLDRAYVLLYNNKIVK